MSRQAPRVPEPSQAREGRDSADQLAAAAPVGGTKPPRSFARQFVVETCVARHD